MPSFLLHDSGVLEPEPCRGGEETQHSSPSISRSLSYSRSNLDLSHSIAHFPSFNFNPNSLSSLSLLAEGARKVNLLLAVLEVDGPDTIKIKNGRDAGKEVAILKLIVGDEEGRVGKLTAWREIAEIWGGSLEGTTAVKRGDVVLLEGTVVQILNLALTRLEPDRCQWFEGCAGIAFVNGIPVSRLKVDDLLPHTSPREW